jgi:hypothetical protein
MCWLEYGTVNGTIIPVNSIQQQSVTKSINAHNEGEVFSLKHLDPVCDLTTVQQGYCNMLSVQPIANHFTRKTETEHIP